jgi:hypothetical protein
VKKAGLQTKKAPAAKPETGKADARNAPPMAKPAKSANASKPERRAGVQR